MSEAFEIQDRVLKKCLLQNADVMLPNDITDVDRQAFNGIKFKSFTVPDDLIQHQPRKMGGHRISFCNVDCDTLNFEGRIRNMDGIRFEDAKIGKVVLPSKLKRMGQCLFVGNSVEIGEMIIPEGTEEIDNSFHNVRFGKIVLPKSLKKITAASFTDCIFNDLIIDTSIKEIATITFSDCCAKSISLMGDIQLIGARAFQKCKIDRLQLPKNLKTIQRYAFWEANIKEIVLPDTVVRIEKEAFIDCKAERIVLSPNIMKIELHTFAGCTNLSELVLPENLEYLNMSAISMCPKLKKLTLPPALKEIQCFGVDYRSDVEEVVNYSSLQIDKRYFPKLKTVINCGVDAAGE